MMDYEKIAVQIGQKRGAGYWTDPLGNIWNVRKTLYPNVGYLWYADKVVPQLMRGSDIDDILEAELETGK